jgi:putative transcriptional regulator
LLVILEEAPDMVGPTSHMRLRDSKPALMDSVNVPLTMMDQALRGENAMQRLRLKADGRIVEIRDGEEFPIAPASRDPAAANVRALRLRNQLTQEQFAAKLGVPLDTIRNWEQGKRTPRGPARALLTLIARAPELAYAALASNGTKARA